MSVSDARATLTPELELGSPREDECDVCRTKALPVVPMTAGMSLERRKTGSASSTIKICEPCSFLAAWHWRRQSTPSLPAHPIASLDEAHAAVVLIVRERFADEEGAVPDFQIPWDVLMVPQGVGDAYCLPGGKLEPGEAPVAAAVRELAEETGITTWPTALEALYHAYDARGRLVTTFLCRAYGEVIIQPGEAARPTFAWKPWPPSAHAGSCSGYYLGMEHAFAERELLARARQSDAPLCQALRRAAFERVQIGLAGDAVSPGDREYAVTLSYGMSEEEKAAAAVILREVARSKEIAPREPEAAPEPPGDEAGGVEDAFGDDVTGED